MASPTSNLSSVIKLLTDADVKKTISTENLQNEPKGDILESMENSFQSFATPYNQVINDSTSPPCADIPQWKKDLIQRRKTNISKTLVANQINPATANTPKVTASTTTPLGASTSDSKSSLIVAPNNKCENLMIRAQNANTLYDTKINTSHSQHSFSSALNLNNVFKSPASFQQQIEMESYGGHYTQVNNKSSGGTHNYNEMLAARTSSIIQPTVPLTRSFAIVEQNSNDGNSTSAQENVKFRKNMSEQHEPTNTTSSDSLLTSTSRLSSSLKVAVAAEIYKKSNKDLSSACVSEQQTHILQEPDLATHVSNNNGNGGDDDDEQQLHHQFKSEQESDNLSSSCTSVNLSSPKEVDSKLFVLNNTTNSFLLSSKVVSNKKTCGIVSTSVRSSLVLPTSQFAKNQNIGSSTLVSSHNHKINTKYRVSQNSPSVLSVSATELPTVTNNKKKMVAVQEMNEITNNELDFDPSEELQYGPGIVSKLRCRYLSLAMRQSMGKQRLSMDTLRRATSLNNLLDDNDVHDDDDEDDDILDSTNKEESSATLVPISNMRIENNSIKLNETVTGFKKNLKKNLGERITGTTHAYSHQQRSRHIKRGNDSLKRARSVEALLCEKSPWSFSNNQTMILSNYETDSVAIEDKINNARDRLLLGTDNSPKRLTSIIDDTERPPPDLVKQTLKIFEASASRRGRVLSRSSGGEVATKVANYKSIITQNKPAITFPKPVSPKKLNLKKTSPEANNTPSTQLATTANLFVQAELNSETLSSTPASSSRTAAAFRPKMDFTPIRSGGCISVVEGLSENSPDIIPRHKLLDKTFPANNAVESPVTELTKKIEKLRIESPLKTQTHQPPRKELQSKFSTDSSDRDSEDEDSIDGQYEVNNGDSDSGNRLSRSPLENIAKAGTSQQFPTKSSAVLSNGSSVAKLSEPLHDIPTLSITGTTTVKQIGIIRPLLVEPHYSDNISVAGCTDENTLIQAASSLTSREIEKNRINNEKRTEQLEMNSSMDDLGCAGFTKVNKNIVSTASTSESGGTTYGPAWSSAIINKKKRNPVGSAPENNTMVFNFKDRKEVPDYIDNDIFIFNKKRELPKPNESGYVMLGDLSLETSTDPEDELPICPPSPCDVEFENAYILIDGKSSIKNRLKEAHFRVQFNDKLTSTFEYPSESSVIEDSGSDYCDLSINADICDISLPTSTAAMHISGNQSFETDSPIIHHHVTVEEIIHLPQNNKVLGSLSLGSAPLGNYTPVKAKTENIFQLGVTRVPNSQTDKSGEKVQPKEILPSEYYGELDDPSLEYLKPASDDLTIAYSEGSMKTDLLY